MKIGAEAFAKVGHYLQMVDNKATALSVAYDPSTKQLNSNTVRSIQQCQPVHSPELTVRQELGPTTRSDVKAKSDEVANLKPDKPIKSLKSLSLVS